MDTSTRKLIILFWKKNFKKMIEHAHCKNVLFCITTTRTVGGGGFAFQPRPSRLVTKKCIIGVAYNIILEVTSSIDYKKGSQFQEKLDPNDLLSYYTVFGSMYHMGNSVTCSILRVC